MNKLTSLTLAATLATVSLFPAAVHAASGDKAYVSAGKSLYTADGKRLGTIYSVHKDGNVQIIIDGMIVNIKLDTISKQDRKLVTTLTKEQTQAAN